jgi:hypothetical protein
VFAQGEAVRGLRHQSTAGKGVQGCPEIAVASVYVVLDGPSIPDGDPTHLPGRLLNIAMLKSVVLSSTQSVLEGISRDAGFKSEVLKAQDMHHTTLNRESERLANDVSKVRSEIRCPALHCFLPSEHSSVWE